MFLPLQMLTSARSGWPHLQTKDSKDYRLWWLDGMLGFRKYHRPHAHAFLIHVIPLREDKLTTGEMAVATGIISCRRCFQPGVDVPEAGPVGGGREAGGAGDGDS